MLKHILSICLVGCIVLLSGCTELSPIPSEQPSSTVTDPDKYADDFENAWQYNTLSADEKVYYGHLYSAVKDAETQQAIVTITDETGVAYEQPGIRVSLPDANLTKERITALFEALFRDNPQFFYLSRTYHLEGYSIGESDTVSYDGLILEFTMSLEQRVDAIAALENRLRSVEAGCLAYNTDYEKELYLHDRLAKICCYDQETADANTDTDSNAYTAYGALVEGKAVCEGYAKAMQLLLQRASIPATVVSGHSLKTGEAHMWNLVKINGQPYHLDPTWNDSGSFLQHTYFNLTTHALSSTHKIDEQQSAVVVCTATTDNYFLRNNAYIDTYEREKIAQAIARQVLDNKQVIQLKFAPGKYSNGQLFLKNSTLTHQMVNPYLAEKGLSLWDYQLWADEEQQVLSLVKH